MNLFSFFKARAFFFVRVFFLWAAESRVLNSYESASFICVDRRMKLEISSELYLVYMMILYYKITKIHSLIQFLIELGVIYMYNLYCFLFVSHKTHN